MAKKPKLPKDIDIKCNGIIHGASVAAGTAGAAGAQLPVADNAVITPIQIGMIIALAKVFDRNLTREAALGILKGAGAAFIGRGVSQLLVGWVPGLGNVINTATAASLTEAIGWMSAGQFYDEWLNEGHSPEDVPESLHEEESDRGQSESKEKTHKEELMEQADFFINGKKDAKGADKDEFVQLFNDMSYELADLSEDDPFRSSFKEQFDRLAECLK